MYIGVGREIQLWKAAMQDKDEYIMTNDTWVFVDGQEAL